MVGYYVYKLVKGSADECSGRALLAAAIAGYIGLNAAALITALEFGSQYHLFQASDGTPLYFMYPIKVAVGVVMSEHLLLAGPVEGLITLLGLRFVASTHPELLFEQKRSKLYSEKEAANNV
jgi:cobalt/nickel transport system permease protein